MAENNAQEEELQRPEWAARRLNLSVFTIYPYARKGIIPSVRVGKSLRFSPSAIEKYIQEKSQGGNPQANI